MRTIKHIFLALMSLFTLSAFAQTAFTPDEIGQVKITSSGSTNYVDYQNSTIFMSYVDPVNLGSDTQNGSRFNESYASGTFTVSTKSSTEDSRMYYSTFYTKVTIPADTIVKINYTFSGKIEKNSDGAVALIYELFDYGDQLSADEGKTIHKSDRASFNISNNDDLSNDYSIKRARVNELFNRSTNINVTVSKTYDNSGNPYSKEITNYWGGVAASQTATWPNEFTFSATFTPSFTWQFFTKSGYTSDDQTTEPDKDGEYYLIKNEANLYWFASQVNGGKNTIKAKVVNDIYIANQTVLDESLNLVPGNYKSWSPIGTSSNPFQGEFLGQGHTISGVVVNATSGAAGLFGYVDNKCTIKDVKLVNSYIKGTDYVGGIVGYANNSGKNQSTIQNCLSEAYVEGNNYVGGIVGYAKGYLVEKYQFPADYVYSTHYAVNIYNCSCLGNVKGSTNYVGGVIGYLEYSNANNLSFSGNLIDKASDKYYGSIYGYSLNHVSINNIATYNNSAITSGGNIVYGKNKASSEVTVSNTSSYDSDGITSSNSNIITILNNNANTNNWKNWELRESFSGNKLYIFKRGTSINPFEIVTKEDLEQLAEEVANGKSFEDKYFVIVDDIDDPITSTIGKQDKPFSGNIDGDGHHINLDLDDNINANGNGFIAYTNGATIKNIVVIGKVSGNSYIAGIVGNAKNSEILNCSNVADITAKNSAGGIVGVSINTTIKYCSNAGTVKADPNSGSSFTGGAIVGIINNKSIESCFWYEKSANDAVGSNLGNTATLNEVKSYKFNNGKLIINNPSSSSDLIQVLNGYANANSLDLWSTFIGQENPMFAFDFWPTLISKYKWSSLCLPFKTRITSDNGTAYYAVANDDKKNIEKIEANVIPAGEGVFVNGESGANVIFKFTTDAADDITNNDVIGTTQEGGETFGPDGQYKYYMLSTNSGIFGLYWDGKTKDEGKSCICQQYKAILKVDQTTANTKSFFSFDEFETGILENATGIDFAETTEKANTKTIHNLSGQMVGKSYKGIVIINGKKYLK